MRALTALILAGLAGPAMAMAPQEVDGPEGLRIYSPSQFGVTAETPSRIADSRAEMNRGRNPSGGVDVEARAASAVARAGLVCDVAEAAVVGRTRGGGPLIEIDCVEGGGVIIADSDPIQVVDCLDLAPDTGQAGRRQRVVTTCRLPGNADLAERAQSARN